MIPIVVENERRREKEIKLDMSEWTTKGGKVAPIKTAALDPKTFTLGPCEKQKILLAVDIKGTDSTSTGAKNDERKTPSDADDCLVATADLRLVGCDHRPLRLAIALLPRDCDPYWVSCGCICC